MFAARAQRSSQCAKLNFTMWSERIKIFRLLLSVRNSIHFAYKKFKTPFNRWTLRIMCFRNNLPRIPKHISMTVHTTRLLK
jgi:hypothetical protein